MIKITAPAYPDIAIAPCPFCRCKLRFSPDLSTRTMDFYYHPDMGCFLDNARVIVDDHGSERLVKWNRRVGISAATLQDALDATNTTIGQAETDVVIDIDGAVNLTSLARHLNEPTIAPVDSPTPVV